MAKKQPVIPVAPKAGGSTNLGTVKSGGGSAAKGGAAKDPISGAEKRANARESAAKKKAADKYKAEAKLLGDKAKIAEGSLNSGAFRDALRTRLANIDIITGQQDKALLDDYGARVGDLSSAKDQNDAAAGDSSVANLMNRARERGSALTEAMNMGAGESDVLKSGLMALRSWDSNQNEINRSFFDSLQSINSSLGDLNIDTKTARMNVAQQAGSDKDAAWTEYFNRKSQQYTDISNIRGQQANVLGQAKEQDGKIGKQQKAAEKAALQAYKQATKESNRVHENPGIDPAIVNWRGQADFEGTQTNSLLVAASGNVAPRAKPSGAGLRKWST